MVDGRRNLETSPKDTLLALKANISGPLDETRNITLGLNVLTNTMVARSALKERIAFASFLGWLLDGIRSRSNLLASRLLCGGLSLSV